MSRWSDKAPIVCGRTRQPAVPGAGRIYLDHCLPVLYLVDAIGSTIPPVVYYAPGHGSLANSTGNPVL
ncbi:MAG: hypothetical protein KatS3mg109_0322 [Pirellulaceae bacterium]|nr:MAG: hypothetical protein KatS3mg109_0322 [Pirellulaceae bacterium]